jgi:hypothetical protein
MKKILVFVSCLTMLIMTSLSFAGGATRNDFKLRIDSFGVTNTIGTFYVNGLIKNVGDYKGGPKVCCIVYDSGGKVLRDKISGPSD